MGKFLMPANSRSPRKNMITVRVSADEMVIITDKARQAGGSREEFLRRLALGYRLQKPPIVMPQTDHETVFQLGKIGGLLNQIARALNSGKPAELTVKHIEAMHATVKGFRDAITDGFLKQVGREPVDGQKSNEGATGSKSATVADLDATESGPKKAPEAPTKDPADPLSFLDEDYAPPP
jgi:hypothetical protein